jgi:hypothetical protein
MELGIVCSVKKARKPLEIECNGIAIVFRYSKFSTTPFVTACQVIGNVYEEFIHHRNRDVCLGKRQKVHSQLQQGQVGVAVECPVLALLCHVVLEDGGSLGVVAIEAIEDGIDMSRPGFTLVEGDHLGCCLRGDEGGSLLDVFLVGFLIVARVRKNPTGVVSPE